MGKRVAILGAGMTGLAAGVASGRPVYEGREVPGGICSSRVTFFRFPVFKISGATLRILEELEYEADLSMNSQRWGFSSDVWKVSWMSLHECQAEHLPGIDIDYEGKRRTRQRDLPQLPVALG